MSDRSERVERAERARARRTARGRALDQSVPSPCIAVCTLDPAHEHCIGCYRTLDEIRDWPILSSDEKRAVLSRLEARRRDDR